MSASNEQKRNNPKSDHIGEKDVRPSISVRLIRHSESLNNQVYRDARHLFNGGTQEFNLKGWVKYVDERRNADPGLSDIGKIQAKRLAEYLESHLKNQASRPVHFVVSPMRRAIETILPTLIALNKTDNGDGNVKSGIDNESFDVLIQGFYHESEGCHTREKVEPGMNANQISSMLESSGTNASFVGFPNGPDFGWYSNKTGPETRPESEERAAKFYVWLVEYLDQQLYEAKIADADDIFDAGVTLPGEEHEHDHDRLSPRTRRRRSTIFVGHGDFMSLVLKRIVAGFGHSVEEMGVSHRSAFVHFNTGITELEYFGNGRFLVMSMNQIPHLSGPDDRCYISGGSLKDGWSYLMPPDKFLLDAEVTVAFSDEIKPHVQEQTDALRSLYLGKTCSRISSVEDGVDESAPIEKNSRSDVTIVVKRGLQVVGCATLDEDSGLVSDVVVRPSARNSQVGRSLIEAVKSYVKQSNKVNEIRVELDTAESRAFFEKMGFSLVERETLFQVEKGVDNGYTSEIVRMECKL